MATYWHKHAGNFANLCDIVRLDDADNSARTRSELEELGYERITRRATRAHVAWVNAENDAWGSGRAMDRIDLAAIVAPHDDSGYSPYHPYDAMAIVLEYRDRARHYAEHWGYDN
jgi:hypothetical protein